MTNENAGWRSRAKLRVFAVAAIAVLLFGGWLVLLDRPAALDYYKPVDAKTIIVGAGTGPTMWARVTSVSESDTSVTVEVSSIALPVPSTGQGVTELTVNLRTPLGEREVIDGHTGDPVMVVSP